MDASRQGEIALQLIRFYVSRRGIPAVSDVKMGIIKISKETGLSTEELVQFADEILSDTLKQAMK